MLLCGLLYVVGGLDEDLAELNLVEAEYGSAGQPALAGGDYSPVPCFLIACSFSIIHFKLIVI
jgi:hypothetical protein